MAVGAMFAASLALILIAASAINICASGYFCLGGTVARLIDVDGTQRPRAGSAAPYTGTRAHAFLPSCLQHSPLLSPPLSARCVGSPISALSQRVVQQKAAGA